MFKRSAPKRIAGGALAIVIAAMLTGCFANPLDSIMEKASEESAKSAAEGLIETMTGGEAGIELGSLPADFPKEIPLVDGDILQGMSLPEGTMVVLDVPRDLDEVAAEVKADFADWEEVSFVDMDQMVSAGYKKGSMGVSVTIMQGAEDEPTRVGYTVPTAEEE